MQQSVRPSGQAPTYGPLVVSAAAFSGGAAVIHFAAMESHFDEYWAFGVFFLVVAIAQVVSVIALLLRPVRAVIIATVAGDAAVIGVWMVTRTTGLPFGPEPGEPEAVNFQDALATGLEVLLVVAGCALLRVRETGRVRLLTTRSRASVALLTVTVAVLTGVSLVVGGGTSHDDAVAHDGQAEGAHDGADSDAAGRSFKASADHLTLTFSLEPGSAGSNTFHLYFSDEDGALVDVADDVAVQFVSDGAPNPVAGTGYPAGPGHVSGLVTLPTTGTWRVTVTAIAGDGEAASLEGAVLVE